MSRHQKKLKKNAHRFTVKVRTHTKNELKWRAKDLHCTESQLADQMLANQLANTSARPLIRDREFQLLAASLTQLIARLNSLWHSIARRSNQATLVGKVFAGAATLDRVGELRARAIATRDQLGGVWAGLHPHPKLADSIKGAQALLPSVMGSTATPTGGNSTALDIAKYLVALNILADPGKTDPSGS